MGWWKIDSVERGQIDWKHSKSGLVNAIPGQDTPVQSYNGDGPADLMDSALDKINKQYKDAWNRPARPEELKAVFNFCFNGMMRLAKKAHK